MTNFKSHARSGLSKEEFKSRLLDWARTDGYATAYAPTNREEDFCETFELFVMNGYKISGLERALDKDLTLKKKLRAIRELMKLGRAGRLKLRRDRRYRTDQPLVVEESPYIYGFPTLMIEESQYIYGFPTKPERDPDFNRYIAKSNEAQVQLAKASHLKQDSQ